VLVLIASASVPHGKFVLAVVADASPASCTLRAANAMLAGLASRQIAARMARHPDQPQLRFVEPEPAPELAKA